MIRIKVIIAILTLPLLSFGQTSLNIELLDHWENNTLLTNSSNVRYNECWGFKQNGQEYAIAGSTEGTHFFLIGDNDQFQEVDTVRGRFSSSMVIHRDYKIYRNYAYAVCDEGESSLQIIDLSYLPDSVHKVADIDDTFARVHNLYIDSANALMYACTITPKVGGILQSFKSMEVFSLADPLNPQLVYSGPTDIPEVHDAYVRDNIAYLNCGFDGLRVYDFTDPANPVFLQNITFYEDQGYNHQGWLTPNGKRYVFGDETEGKRLKICSVDGGSLLTIDNTFGSNYQENSVPHNIMLSNEYAYVAYYNEGLRVYDIRSNEPKEIAFYDTYPQDSQFKMYGAWGVYSELPSGRLLVSDRVNGLFLLDFREDIFLNTPVLDLMLYPNPAAKDGFMTIRFNKDDVHDFTVRIHDLFGHEVSSTTIFDQTYTEIRMPMAAGVYSISIEYQDYLGETLIERQKIVVE